MKRYLVFEPTVADGAEGAALPTDRAVFVRDAFAKWAVLFPFLWLFRHGLWLSGLLVLAASIGLGILVEDVPGLGLAAALLPLLLGCLVALEGPALRAARYRRKGFMEAAVLQAGDEDEAAILYYAGAPSRAAPEEPGPAAPALPPRALRPRPRSLLDPVGRS